MEADDSPAASPGPPSRSNGNLGVKENGGSAVAVVGDSPGSYQLGWEERQLLEQGKAEHRDTTATAKRALEVAEKTTDVARSTLVEMHRQGQQLERAELGLQQVGEEVKEASAILRFMRRWCCFQCSDCCDPTVQQDRTRKKRVSAMRQELAYQQQNVALQYSAKQQAVDRQARQHDPAYGSNEGAARQELFAQAAGIRAARRVPKATDIGLGLPEDDRREIQQETDQQDEIINKIGDAVTSLHTMSKEMYGEVREQQPRIERLNDRALATHDQLGSLTREARRV